MEQPSWERETLPEFFKCEADIVLLEDINIPFSSPRFGCATTNYYYTTYTAAVFEKNENRDPKDLWAVGGFAEAEWPVLTLLTRHFLALPVPEDVEHFGKY